MNGWMEGRVGKYIHVDVYTHTSDTCTLTSMVFKGPTLEISHLSTACNFGTDYFYHQPSRTTLKVASESWAAAWHASSAIGIPLWDTWRDWSCANVILLTAEIVV